jgi:hypothetical protein
MGLDALAIIDAGSAMVFGILAMLTLYPSIIIVGSIRTNLKIKKE